jgi:extracellular factor (EF) 3-hydroxypalmitic acid methyl ester biosynthesis protein
MDIKSIEIEGSLFQKDKQIEVVIKYASKYSLMVRFKNSDHINNGIEFTKLSLQVNDSITELGPCRLITETAINGFSNRLIFSRDVYNMDTFFQNNNLEKLQADFQNLPLILSYKDNIDQKFKDYTSDLIYDLRVYKTFFDNLDLEYQFEPDHIKNEVQQAIMRTEGEKLLNYMDIKLDELKLLVKNYRKRDHEQHGFFFRKQLQDFIHSSAFMKRCNVKPRGYAGDSVMMSMIYSRSYYGESTFEKLMHKHPIEVSAAQAVRNRRRLIIDILNNIQSNRSHETTEKMNVLSVACGPAYETQDILKTPEDCQKYHFFLLDQDQKALTEAAEIISKKENELKTKISTTILNDSVRTMLALSRLKKKWEVTKFPFIYSLGLFDYLTPPVAKAVLGNLFQLLEPGGEMVVGNFHVSNPNKHYMEYWVDWVLYHRTEDDLLDMMTDISTAETKIIFEETGSQMFLHVKKIGDRPDKTTKYEESVRHKK